MDLQDFLNRNRIEESVWRKASISWETLEAIAEDHQSQLNQLQDAAEIFARAIQRISAVHSVRWRIKNADHLLEKIIRKRAKEIPKYLSINIENYFEVVTDLIGLRALHLFKGDCISIDQELQNIWTPIEKPIIYVREGDSNELVAHLGSEIFEIEKHPAGYRSIHYIFSTRPLNRTVCAEIQVRTIFEEGWSEIDHHIRYPNFSKNELVGYFLTIFNRLAGNADEMGTFVQGLTEELKILETKINQANSDRESALSEMDRTLKELEIQKKSDIEIKKKLATLQAEITKLRNVPNLGDISKNMSQASLGALASLGSLGSLSSLGGLGALESLGSLGSLSSLGGLGALESLRSIDFTKNLGRLVKMSELAKSPAASVQSPFSNLANTPSQPVAPSITPAKPK